MEYTLRANLQELRRRLERRHQNWPVGKIDWLLDNAMRDEKRRAE